MTIYNSRDARCKTPFGAAKTMEEVAFTIYLPKESLDRAPALKLFVVDRWEEPILLPMEFQGGDRLRNHYRCTFTPQQPCLYLYCFELYSGGRTHYLKRGEGGDAVQVEQDQGDLWQLTVYDAAMESPTCLPGDGVLYQIFPDRFCNSGTPKENVPGDRTLHADWYGLPDWRPDYKGEITNSDYFGGDLRGIQEKLPYLRSLGVTALYLNPIFEAHSNHRYNTADYRKVDPLLGTNQDFQALCDAAHQLGIGVILDGVFSHTGSDSVYFNKEKRYGEGGAYHDPDSPYRQWFKFSHYPHQYESWWGFITLPNVEEENPSYLDFICGEQGVLHQWMDLGADGFRIDVADELPDAFLDALHDSVKGYGGNRAVIGEVWEDASHKESYGVRRRYLQGGQLDSVMNYPFKDAILHYIRWGSGQALLDTILQILENYPPPAIRSLMNSLSTHDTVRAITALAGDGVDHHDREWQAQHHHLSPEAYHHGCCLFLLASILQYGLPGTPCLYYGDEAGLCGYKDPFNRQCYPWGRENSELLTFLQQLGAIRTSHPIFADAQFVPVTFGPELCVFVRQGETQSVLFAVNRSHQPRPLLLPPGFHQADNLAQCGEYTNTTLGPFSGIVLLGKSH